jgi:hypothetical protein
VSDAVIAILTGLQAVKDYQIAIEPLLDRQLQLLSENETLAARQAAIIFSQFVRGSR